MQIGLNTTEQLGLNIRDFSSEAHATSCKRMTIMLTVIDLSCFF